MDTSKHSTQPKFSSQLLLQPNRPWTRRTNHSPCLTSQSARTMPLFFLTLQPRPRQDATQIHTTLHMEATPVLIWKTTASTPSLKVQTRSSWTGRSPSERSQQLSLNAQRQANQPKIVHMPSRKLDGRERSRPNCVGSGWEAFSARISSRTKDADSLTDKRNFRRKRLSADSTSHRYARTSWNTQASALMGPDASSSIQPWTWEKGRAILAWWRTTRDTPQWDCSRRSKVLMYST